MSMNLRLSDRDAEFPLLQTPTTVTYVALKSSNPKAVYAEHLRTDVWPWLRGSYEGKRNQAAMATHMNELHLWMQAHPNAKWSMT